MVRFQKIATATLVFPPKLNININIINNNNNCILNFASTKHKLLSLLKLPITTKHASQIHAQLHLSGLHHDTFLVSELIRVSSLSSSRNLAHAHSILANSIDSLPSSWNFLIRGYSNSNTPRNAAWVYSKMRRGGVRPNELTFPFVLKAYAAPCFAVEEGRAVHCDVVKFGLDCDVYVNNNLIHFYGSCKWVLDACRVFDEMPERSVVSWNSVINGCVGCSLFEEAVRYFVKMGDFGFEPDQTTMVIMLSVCAEVGNLSLGKWVHSQVILRGMKLNYQLGTALVDMYAKGGNIYYARRVFNLMEEKNVFTWSAMILGLAQHGFAKEGLDLFIEMIRSSSIHPNCITFLGVLCACSHAGFVDDGFRYFHDMVHEHGIQPMVVHYGAMVDILGRAGRLKEAYDFILNLPFEPDAILWRTLLSACSVHDINDNSGIAEKARTKLMQLEPRRSGNFVMVANMYADSGMWDKAASIRKDMRGGGLKKTGGESCIELNGSVYQFFSGFNDVEEYQYIYQLLDDLNLHMKMVCSL